MERTYIADIKNNLGKPVLVQGFVENLRDSKYMAFIVLKDISGKIQITVEKEKLPGPRDSDSDSGFRYLGRRHRRRERFRQDGRN